MSSAFIADYLFQPSLWAVLAGTAALIAAVGTTARKFDWRRPILLSVVTTVAVLLVACMFGGLASRSDAMATDGAGKTIEIVAMIGALSVYVGPMAGVLKALERENAWLRAALMMIVGLISLPIGIVAWVPIAGGLAMLFK